MKLLSAKQNQTRLYEQRFCYFSYCSNRFCLPAARYIHLHSSLIFSNADPFSNDNPGATPLLFLREWKMQILRIARRAERLKN
jgi:hypothetical protein